jgi:hypothetical protein
MTASGSQAAVSSQNPFRTGMKSSTARLSLTTTSSGRSAMRRRSTSSRAFAVGESPETRMRTVPSLRWEATRVKAGSISTSAKSSRTKGRSMQDDFSRIGIGDSGFAVFLPLRSSLQSLTNFAVKKALSPKIAPDEARCHFSGSCGRWSGHCPGWNQRQDRSFRCCRPR